MSLPLSNPSTQDTEISEQIVKNIGDEKLFLNKKRLKKKSEIILEKQIHKKIATNYFDNEAELGSDNEEHDEVVKKIVDSENENDPNLDLSLEDIIDDNVENKNDQKDKFIDDMFDKDKEEIRKVINGPVRRPQPKKDRIEINESELPLKIRIERMAEGNKEEDNEEANFNNVIKKYKALKGKFEGDMDNEELKEAMTSYQANVVKKINKMNKTYEKEIKERIKEDQNILKNVVIANKKSESENSKSANNKLLVKGNGMSLNTKAPSLRFGSFMNKNNSFLCHIKNEKGENENKESNIRKSSIQPKKLPGFANNFQISSSALGTRAGNLTTLFTRKK